MKRVIVISTSLRRGSNSDMLADKFVEGAKAAGNDVEKISLVGKDIQFCKGCFACQKLGRCIIKDDVNDILAKVLEADVVCWAGSTKPITKNDTVEEKKKDGQVTEVTNVEEKKPRHPVIRTIFPCL